MLFWNHCHKSILLIFSDMPPNQLHPSKMILSSTYVPTVIILQPPISTSNDGTAGPIVRSTIHRAACKDTDILVLSEHWLWPFEFHKFNDIHPSMKGIAVADKRLTTSPENVEELVLLGRNPSLLHQCRYKIRLNLCHNCGNNKCSCHDYSSNNWLSLRCLWRLSIKHWSPD